MHQAEINDVDGGVTVDGVENGGIGSGEAKAVPGG